ncbi:helix-turn-helix domain-containing protein [Actinomadura scrupuli]|uniref:helix-turn-helix domain-containing protein n=1 Tax=Actinomadura scrupuli TaxID=559629 RepID=UPI003D959CFF
MALRSSPTIRQRRLASELERLREAAGPTREGVAERLDWHPTKLYRIENARSGITPADMRHLLDLYGVTDGRQRDALLKLARHAKQKGWWTKYQDVFQGSYVELEAEASTIRTFEPIFVPGLLQTAGYSRALLRASLVVRDIERRIEARMARQEVLDRDDAPHLWAVIDEAALIRPVGGPAVMGEQLDRLIEIRERENITLQVLPISLGAHPGMDGTFVMLDFPDSDFFAPVVHLETATDGLYLEEPEEVARYTLIFDHLRAIALGPDESVNYLHKIKKQFV